MEDIERAAILQFAKGFAFSSPDANKFVYPLFTFGSVRPTF